MRVSVLFLLFVVGCSTSLHEYFESKFKNGFGRNGDDVQEYHHKIKNFKRTNMTVVSEKLGKLRKRWSEKLKLNKDAEAELGECMKKLRPKKRERVNEDGDTLAEVNEKANVDGMYQGDIVLTVEQADTIVDAQENDARRKRQAYKDRFYPGTIWGDTVYFYFDTTATTAVKNAFIKAADFWQQNTCINFQESTTARNRIKVFKDQGCYSYIGKIGGVQELSLGPGCESVGTAAHEIGHALGFFHTQSRSDRDDAIIVNVNNIERDFVDQFDKETSSTNFNYGMPYDYGSVMQYGALSASRNGNPTMVAKDAQYQDTMGSDMVGFYDVSMINEHYNCKAKCPTASSAKCANGGFPNPRTCSQCICPSGFGGALCNERPSGCGRTLTATGTFQTLSDTIGDGSNTRKDDFDKCNYWIQAPAGSRIEVRLKSFSGTFTDGCVYGGVEIKTNSDPRKTGYRFCENADAGETLTSTSNIVPIVTFNRYRTSKTQLEYRIVGGAPTSGPGPVTAAPPPTTTTRRSPAPTPAPTRAPTPRTTTPRPTNNCRDQYEDCELLSYFGYCRRRNIRRTCRFSCGRC